MSEATELTQQNEAQLPAATSDSTTALISMIERASTNPEVDVEKMERLWSMYDRERQRQAEQAFNAAMNRAQSQLHRVAADAENKQTNSKYATYAALDRALRPVYSEEGFSLSFDTGEAPGEQMVRVVCYVSHKHGHSREYHVDMPADGKGAKGNDVMTKTHAAGSAMSYGMRYLLKLIFNVAVGEDDDDGNGAGGDKPGLLPISEEQVNYIEELLKERQVDRDKFLRHFKVTKVEDIKQQAFDDAVKGLKNKPKKETQ